MSKRQQAAGADRFVLCNLTLAGALTGAAQPAIIGLAAARVLNLEAILTVAGGGTTAKVWIQTSIDGGNTWFDVANFAFTNVTASKLSAVVDEPSTVLPPGTAPGSGALADNTVLNGALGDRFRALVTTTGTFTGATTLQVFAVTKT